MEKEKKKEICELCFTWTGILVFFIALFYVGKYLRPENNDLEQLVGGFQAALKTGDKNALRGMFPLDQQTDQLLDKLVNLPDNITMDLNGGNQSSVTIVAKGELGSMKLITLTPNDPNIACHGSFAACFLDMVDTLPDNPEWEEHQMEKVQKQMRLVLTALKKRFFKFLKNLMKPGLDIDQYLKKQYREVKGIKVDHIEEKSTKNVLTAYLSIHQGKEEVVAKISMIPNKESPTGFIVSEGIICNGTICSDQ